MGFLKVCFEVRGVRGEEIIEFVLFLLSNLVTDPSFMSILPSEFYPISWEVRDTPPSPHPPRKHTHTPTLWLISKLISSIKLLFLFTKNGKLLKRREIIAIYKMVANCALVWWFSFRKFQRWHPSMFYRPNF